MAFEILQARSADDPPDLLYPTPSVAKNSFELEEDDGAIDACEASAVISRVLKGERSQETGRAEGIEGILAITGSRLVFACTEFRTGGGMVGYGSVGALVAVTANAVSKAAAVRGTRGYSLVGHVRHGWLRTVVAQDYKWRSSPNVLKLTFDDPVDDAFRGSLSIWLPKRTPARDLAERLARRAASARAMSATGELSERLHSFSTAPTSKPLDGGGGNYWIVPR